MDGEAGENLLPEVRDSGYDAIAGVGDEPGVVLDAMAVRRYLTLVRTTVSSKGQLVLPAEVRRRDGIRAGQAFEIERIADGEYRLVRVVPPTEGLVDWLLACPEKGYFVRVESGSTDEL